MTTIAFLGLGRMGTPMAGRVPLAGHDLIVWNRTAERAQPLVAEGARAERPLCLGTVGHPSGPNRSGHIPRRCSSW